MNCVETETHSPCKKPLQKSFPVINSTSMQESWQTHQADPRGVSDLIDVEVTVCDICGDVGLQKLLAICNNCGDGAEHIYCMRVKLEKVPDGDWICEECLVGSECQKSESPVNLESWNSSELKFKSSHAWKSQTEDISSISDLPANRHGVPSKAQSVKKDKVIGISAEPLRSSNERWQAERPNEAATAMKLHKLSSGLGSDESSQFEAAIHSENQKPDYIWLGKVELHGSVEIPRGPFWIQAHLSIYASEKVFEMADRLPELLILDELPRLSIWPSQFIEIQAKDENVDLYFFEKNRFTYRGYYRPLMEYLTKHDLALKGSLDGVELLIFPSNVLLGKSQCPINSLSLWGVFRGQEVNNSPNTQVPNSQKLENRDVLNGEALDLNAYPADENGMVGVDEVGKFDSIGTSSSGDSIWPGGDIYNAGCSDSRRLRMEVQGKSPMEENNNADNVELPSPPSPSPVSPTTCEEDMDPHDWLAVVTLFSLSKRFR